MSKLMERAERATQTVSRWSMAKQEFARKVSGMKPLRQEPVSVISLMQKLSTAENVILTTEDGDRCALSDGEIDLMLALLAHHARAIAQSA